MNSRFLKRLATRGMALVLCALMGVPTLAFGAGLAAQQSDPQSGSTASGSTSGTQPQQPAQRSSFQPGPQRVGVDVNQEMRLSLHDAIVLALDKNLDIAVQRFNVKQAEYDLTGARGVYDFVPGGSLRAGKNTQPVSNQFSGGSASAPISSATYSWNFNLQQNLKSGANYRFDFTNSRNSSSRLDNFFNPTFTNAFSVTVTQPFLKNFRIDSNRRQIQIAKKQLDISDLQFRQRAIDTINSVQKSYWDLVFALENEKIQRDALDLAATQLDNNKKRVEAGDLAPIDITSAEAAVETSKQNVISSLQQVTTAENILKGLLLDDPNSPLWSSVVAPSDKANFVPSAYTLDDAIGVALANRTDVQNMKSQIQLNQIDLNYLHNQLKPQVDFVFTFGSQGLSGTLLPRIDQRTGKLIPGQVLGGAGTAIHHTFTLDATNYTFGINFSFPFQNHSVHASLGRAQAQSRILDLQQKQLVQQVLVAVRNAMQAVESARQRIEAARAGLQNAEAQLKGEQEKYKAGLSTTFFVLQRQNDLSDARGRELQSLTDYNKAIADLQRAMSTTLDSAGVNITHEIPPQDQSQPKKP